MPRVKKPSFFDAIRNDEFELVKDYRMMHSKENADEAFEFLKAVIDHGADRLL